MKRPALAGNRTTSLCSQCSATELQQQDNYQLSQSSVHVLHRCMEPKCPSHIPSFSSYFSLFQCKARVPSKRMGPIDDESCNWHIIASELFRSLRMYSVDGISWNNVDPCFDWPCKAQCAGWNRGRWLGSLVWASTRCQVLYLHVFVHSATVNDTELESYNQHFDQCS